MTYCIPTPIPSSMSVNKKVYLNTDDLIAQCLSFFDMSNAMLKNESRQRQILWPRQMITYVLLNHSALTTDKIAAIFGKDHSTVVTTRKTISNRLEADKFFRVMTQIKFEDIVGTSDVFRKSFIETYTMSMEELFIYFNALDYESFGHGAFMMWKINGSNKWTCGLRNNKEWEESKLDCSSEAPKDALAMLYAWCKHKGYLK